MTLHIFFALAKNVEIILQERERQGCKGSRCWRDTDATFHVIQLHTAKEPRLRHERRQRAWKRMTRSWGYLQWVAANEWVIWGWMVSEKALNWRIGKPVQYNLFPDSSLSSWWLCELGPISLRGRISLLPLRGKKSYSMAKSLRGWHR